MCKTVLNSVNITRAFCEILQAFIIHNAHISDYDVLGFLRF